MNETEIYKGLYFYFSILEKCGLGFIIPSLDDDGDDTNKSFTRTRRKIKKIENYVELTIPRLNDHEFKNHFRITRRTFEIILPIIANKFEDNKNNGRKRINVQKQLLSVLWLLATPDSYRSVSERFDMSKSSLSECFFRIVKILNLMAPDFIKWPNYYGRNINKLKFKNMSGIPNIVGSIDGTYIPIKAPREDPEIYITRKCHYAITLQSICDPNMKFLDCFVGYPGSVSDTRIFRNSDIYNSINEDQERYLSENEFIIGDKAYPVLPWCIAPYIDRGNLTHFQLNFNTKHSKARQVIERAFALLFGRFRRLKFLDMNKLKCIPYVVIAACVLHNMCINYDDMLEIELCLNQDLLLEDENGAEFEGRQNVRNLGHRMRDEICRNINV